LDKKNKAQNKHVYIFKKIIEIFKVRISLT